MGGRQRRVRRRNVGGIVHPEIQDPSRDHDVVRGRQQVTDRVEYRCSAHVGYPQRPETQLLQFRGGVSRRRSVAVTQLVTPDAYARKIHDLLTLHLSNGSEVDGCRRTELAVVTSIDVDLHHDGSLTGAQNPGDGARRPVLDRSQIPDEQIRGGDAVTERRASARPVARPSHRPSWQSTHPADRRRCSPPARQRASP